MFIRYTSVFAFCLIISYNNKPSTYVYDTIQKKERDKTRYRPVKEKDRQSAKESGGGGDDGDRRKKKATKHDLARNMINICIHFFCMFFARTVFTHLLFVFFFHFYFLNV